MNEGINLLNNNISPCWATNSFIVNILADVLWVNIILLRSRAKQKKKQSPRAISCFFHILVSSASLPPTKKAKSMHSKSNLIKREIKLFCHRNKFKLFCHKPSTYSPPNIINHMYVSQFVLMRPGLGVAICPMPHFNLPSHLRPNTKTLVLQSALGSTFQTASPRRIRCHHWNVHPNQPVPVPVCLPAISVIH